MVKRKVRSKFVRVQSQRVALPPAKEEGDVVLGHKGAKLRKGAWVRRMGERTVGELKATGPQQCVVSWNSGPTQAEITKYLVRA